MKIYYKLGVSPGFIHNNNAYMVEMDDGVFLDTVFESHPDPDIWDKEIFKFYARKVLISEGIQNPNRIVVSIKNEEIDNYLSLKGLANNSDTKELNI